MYCKKKYVMKNYKEFLIVYYPIIIAFIAMIYSISLGLSGDFESAQYSAHWPATILLFAIAIRQRRNNFFNKND